MGIYNYVSAEGSWIQGGGRNTAQVPGQLPSGSTSGTSGSQSGAAAVPGPLQHLPPGNTYSYEARTLSFPQLVKHLLCGATACVHDACVSRTTRALIAALLQWLKMEALIAAPANCEVRSEFMSKQMMCRGADNLQQVDNMCMMRSSTITDDLVRERIMENHCFTIMELSSHFRQISCSLLHKIVIEQLF